MFLGKESRNGRYHRIVFLLEREGVERAFCDYKGVTIRIVFDRMQTPNRMFTSGVVRDFQFHIFGIWESTTGHRTGSIITDIAVFPIGETKTAVVRSTNLNAVNGFVRDSSFVKIVPVFGSQSFVVVLNFVAEFLGFFHPLGGSGGVHFDTYGFCQFSKGLSFVPIKIDMGGKVNDVPDNARTPIVPVLVEYQKGGFVGSSCS